MKDLTEQASSVAVVQTAEALDTFKDPARAATVWDRAMPAEMQEWLAALDPAHLPKGRVVLRPDAVAQTVAHLCDMAQMPAGDMRDWLAADITTLADRFAQMMEADYLRMRLDVITTNACRKFHIDAITARLICTYRGTGTQYGLSEAGGDPTEIGTVATGAPILLRGTLWPAIPPSPLLHRSPPIAGTGETRLLLVLDPIYAHDETDEHYSAHHH